MDGVKVMESLDSLWFFTNVLSSNTKPLDIVIDDDDQSAKDSNPKSEPSKSMAPIIQTQSPNEEIVVQSSPKYGDFAAECEEEKKEIRRRSKRRLKSGWDQRRKVVRWLDFGFDLSEVNGFWMMMEVTKCGYGEDDDDDAYNMMMMMPLLSDGMAMREHLKCWAYAVASTVK